MWSSRRLLLVVIISLANNVLANVLRQSVYEPQYSNAMLSHMARSIVPVDEPTIIKRYLKGDDCNCNDNIVNQYRDASRIIPQAHRPTISVIDFMSMDANVPSYPTSTYYHTSMTPHKSQEEEDYRSPRFDMPSNSMKKDLSFHIVPHFVSNRYSTRPEQTSEGDYNSKYRKAFYSITNSPSQEPPVLLPFEMIDNDKPLEESQEPTNMFPSLNLFPMPYFPMPYVYNENKGYTLKDDEYNVERAPAFMQFIPSVTYSPSYY
ncbi:hypothetical protein PUN28_002521 [Cardiocondyla obscurior]|uniref:Uncharacterized protein n=1 Tax=Cardiocondyla obscurior TaxID=286306 RepID=A0AAW2GUP4_9HYME